MEKSKPNTASVIPKMPYRLYIIVHKGLLDKRVGKWLENQIERWICHFFVLREREREIFLTLTICYHLLWCSILNILRGNKLHGITIPSQLFKKLLNFSPPQQETRFQEKKFDNLTFTIHNLYFSIFWCSIGTQRWNTHYVPSWK